MSETITVDVAKLGPDEELDRKVRETFSRFIALFNKEGSGGTVHYLDMQEQLAKEEEPAVLFGLTTIVIYFSEGFEWNVELGYLLRLAILNLKVYIEQHSPVEAAKVAN